MFFLQVEGTPAIYISNGLNIRPLPPSTHETIVQPLVDAGVPYRVVRSMEELVDGGGPLVEPLISDQQLENALRRMLRSLPE